MINKFSILYKDYVDSIRTKGISLEVSGVCPLQCPFCLRQEVDKEYLLKQPHSSMEDFYKLVNFCKKKIRFCGQTTDPIYNPQFDKMIEHCSTIKTKKFSVHTNGTRKKLEWWKNVFSLSRNNIRWVFGLDGTDQETANIYRVNTRYDEVLEVMKLGSSMGVDVIWQFIVFRHNEHQVELAKQIAKEHKITLQLIASHKWDSDLVARYNIHPPINKQWNTENLPPTIQKIIFLKPI